MSKVVDPVFERGIYRASLIFVGLAPAVLSLMFHFRVSLRIGMAVQCAYVLWILSRLGFPHKRGVFFSAAFLLLVHVLGIGVGLINCVEGLQPWSTWLSYGSFGLASWFALLAGASIAQRFDVAQLGRIVLIFALGDVLLFIPRIAILGLATRSPWGSTLWLTATVLIFLAVSNSRVALWAGLISAGGILGALLGGMRSSLLLMALSLLLASVLLFRSRSGASGRKIALIVALPLALTIGSLVAPPEVKNAFNEKLMLVAKRMEVTIFHSESLRLDEDRGGRESRGRLRALGNSIVVRPR